MTLAEGDEDIRVVRADHAGRGVHRVHGAIRQPDVIQDVIDFLTRDGVSNGVFDIVAEARRFLDPRAGLGPHMEDELAAVDTRKKS